jgi:sterol desaturase/sphingolipid hydroxylase (fatty acid hydroxylase superfamily)
MAIQGHSVRLFRSDLLERLSRVHPMTPLLLWTPVIMWLSWRSVVVDRLQLGILAWLAAAGLLVWTLTEYLVHRFVFHLRPHSRVARRLVFIVHGVHHQAPDDPTRLLMPPVPTIIVCALFYALFRAVLGRPWVEPFFAFFLVGYLTYDYIHFAVHHGRPRTRVGRFWRRWHMLHHFVTPCARWGVSSPLWDHIFRTTAGR